MPPHGEGSWNYSPRRLPYDRFREAEIEFQYILHMRQCVPRTDLADEWRQMHDDETEVHTNFTSFPLP